MLHVMRANGRILLPGLLIAALAGASYARLGAGEAGPLIAVHHEPRTVARRAGDLTVNIGGALAPAVERARWRLGNGPWETVAQGAPRVPAPGFVIEVAPARLLPGPNRVTIEAFARGRPPESRTVEFDYDPTPVRLPLRVDWERVAATTGLDSQEGRWEVVRGDDGPARVRPAPGAEGYDRLLLVAGAFPGGRRVETDIIFRREVPGGPSGFGVLTMWGGRPDADGAAPRRGFRFALAWVYSRYKAVGGEFSDKDGGRPGAWAAAYRSFRPVPGVRYRLVAEAWPESDGAGRHVRHRQRLKWWADGEPEPSAWIEVADDEGAPIPPGEYGVALIAQRAQAEFGPVVIRPLSGP